MNKAGKNVHAGHRERMRQRIRDHGLETLQPHEILEYMLYYIIPKRDVNPIAHELIDRFGSLDAVLQADEQALMSVEGVGPVTANYLKVFSDMITAYCEGGQKQRQLILTAADAARYARDLFFRPDKREMAVLCLTEQDELISSEIHEWNSQTPEETRWMMEAIISSGAHRVILVWKRSGKNPDLLPREDTSIEDILYLFRCAEVHIKDIVLLHKRNRFASLRDAGILLDGGNMLFGQEQNSGALEPIIEKSDEELLAKGLDEPAFKR